MGLYSKEGPVRAKKKKKNNCSSKLIMKKKNYNYRTGLTHTANYIEPHSASHRLGSPTHDEEGSSQK